MLRWYQKHMRHHHRLVVVLIIVNTSKFMMAWRSLPPSLLYRYHQWPQSGLLKTPSLYFIVYLLWSSTEFNFTRTIYLKIHYSFLCASSVARDKYAYNVTTDYIKRKGGCGLMDRLFPPVSGEKMAKLLYSLKFLYLKLLGHSSEIRGFFSI